ncbi:hypothetical protein VBH15_09525 [Vagococcus fluvialis]|uniref:hypothetical protein n=1 Tax=Vagococcus fluvialis TaxID=2738 RepID=UPI0022DED7E0|nr:hypothetical protein [Vagococcus fluvialis]
MDKKDNAQSAGCGCLILIILIFAISSCVKSGVGSSDDESFAVSDSEIRAAVQIAVEEEAMISGAKWPWGSEDYNISEVDDKTYNSNGQFTHDGYRYNFNVTVRFNDNETYSILSCRVSR